MNYIGIDFGAENIMIAYIDQYGQIHQIKDGDNQIKNYLYVHNNKWSFATQAKKDRYGRTKKGGNFFDRYKHDFAKELNSKLPTKYNTHKPSELATHMFGHLKKMIDDRFTELNQTIDFNNIKLVITVPVGWNTNNHAAIYSEALSKNGIKNYRLVEEPIAASVSLIKALGKKIDENSTIAVLDIGSSTADLTVVKNSSPMRYIESFRNECGGDHFDRLVLKEICKEDKPDSKKLNTISKFKESYCGDIEDEVTINGCTIIAEEIEKSVAPKYVEELFELFAKLKTQNIDYLIYAGGMSNIGFGVLDDLKTKVEAKFKSIKIVENISNSLKINAICNGAALLAKDPSLIEYKMEYSVWFRAVINGEEQDVEFIKKGQTISENSKNPYYLKRDEKRLEFQWIEDQKKITIIYKDGANETISELEIKCSDIDKFYLKAWFDKKNILHFALENTMDSKECEIYGKKATYHPNTNYLR